MKFIEMNIDELNSASVDLCKLIGPDYHPDFVAYLARGGYLIGLNVAHYFDCPVVELDKHRSTPIDKNSSLLCRLPFWLRHIMREVELALRNVHSNASEVATVSPAVITGRYPLPQNASEILVVDDSIDSGASVIAARKALEACFPDSRIKVAVLNSFIQSSEDVSFDWSLYKNVLLSTPASADSPCYGEFCKLYETDGYRCK